MDDLQQLMDALQSSTRREILSLIWDEERPVGDIAAAFDLSGPTISQHLKVLRDAGLVTMVADGNYRRYAAKQDTLRALRSVVPTSETKWLPADDLPETEHAATTTDRVVTASVIVEGDAEQAYDAFADPVVYSRWLGVPVTLVDGRFSCTMEWGTRIRGRYEVMARPSLIAMRWDFEDDNVPVPGGEMVGYLRFFPEDGNRCRVEVHQLCPDEAAAQFMEVAWAMVLGRLSEGIERAVDDRLLLPERSSRPKRSGAKAK